MILIVDDLFDMVEVKKPELIVSWFVLHALVGFSIGQFWPKIYAEQR